MTANTTPDNPEFQQLSRKCLSRLCYCLSNLYFLFFSPPSSAACQGQYLCIYFFLLLSDEYRALHPALKWVMPRFAPTRFHVISGFGGCVFCCCVGWCAFNSGSLIGMDGMSQSVEREEKKKSNVSNGAVCMCKFLHCERPLNAPCCLQQACQVIYFFYMP